MKKYRIGKMKKRTVSTALAAIMFMMACMPVFAQGENTEAAEETAVASENTEESRPFLALGADLKESEKAVVLDLLGLSGADLSGYDVITITNEEEHAFLGDYVAADVIGTRSLSSVLVEKREAGHGVVVTTKNISYCTTGMYRNALITAGLEDADITVAGPFSITGTAALVGAMKAYSVMTGEEISQESMDAATNELVVTGELADSIGDSDKVEELIALIKQQVIENNLDSEEEIRDAIKKGAEELNIELSDADIDKIISLMDKISGLDLDIDAIKNQAKELYDRLSDLNVDTDGIMEKIGNFFSKLVDAIVKFFESL
ncbi:DUF1002 domain-containing protein [Anaerobium acetethylicum]|uniref:Uncharacterized protein YpuA, DUF1002 family n=1 Tax=Anaerobium acetethylicum TaxID=1619234 RepID=A0A1D3TRP3_9FIRM|nr:DUF1002 domain-containing protein [Anaerobium acetethylicum]SCP96389.1 Uncharacterized protein YpuA, DUF1002 family [Anaerobium acetethylicum]